MTDKQDPITHAARLLREAAEELRQAHTYHRSEGWQGETGARSAYDVYMAAAQALEDWAESIGAGGVSGPLMGQPQAMPDLSALTERGAKAWAGVDAQALRDGTYQQAATKAAPGEPSAFPMTGDEEESDLGQWQPGTAKPNMDGTYLREFDEGEATSEFHQGVWLRDGFFPSDLQDVRWRGRAAPQQEAQEPVSPRHPVVMQWRDNAIEACAKIADAYGHEHAAQDMRAMLTAPQQEAQKPVAWYEYNADLDAWFLAYRRNPKAKTRPLVFGDTTPQQAPAPLSEREAFERDWEKRHAPAPINGRTRDDGRYGDSSIQDAWESWQARAALAAQGGAA